MEEKYGDSDITQHSQLLATFNNFIIFQTEKKQSVLQLINTLYFITFDLYILVLDPKEKTGMLKHWSFPI